MFSDGSQSKLIAMEGIDFESTYKKINVLSDTQEDPVVIYSANGVLELHVPRETVIKTNQSLTIEYSKDDLFILLLFLEGLNWKNLA